MLSSESSARNETGQLSAEAFIRHLKTKNDSSSTFNTPTMLKPDTSHYTVIISKLAFYSTVAPQTPPTCLGDFIAEESVDLNTRFVHAHACDFKDE